ncbi:MAG: hypothetical protein P4K98_06315 [Bryobacteraceae bacterium]|nr:hypothetical protein [Bryobacteraceae bacterium]
MDRTIVYPGSIPLDTDVLKINRNAMVALGALMGMVLGTNAVVDGLGVTPTVPGSLSVVVGAGSVTGLGVVDAGAFGSLSSDADPLVKMGINLGQTTLTMTAPTTAGQSVAWLIEAALLETDTDSVVLPYYNASNPSQPWMGPANVGTSQPTRRAQQVQLQARSGVPATTGQQTLPVADTGWVPLAMVTLAYGQTSVSATDITKLAANPALAYKLPDLRPGFVSVQPFTASGWFVVPQGVSRAKVTVVGGGGAGGTHASLPGAGGGAGGQAIRVLTGLTPGSSYYVTVGSGGAVSASPGAGGPGGTSSFGTLVSATGGGGGGGGTDATPTAGGPGGYGVGGDINIGGSYGTDCVGPACRGGDGGGPGAGRGTTGALPGISAGGPGGGGGGGGCSSGGVGTVGGAGASGIVIVEY